MIARNAGPFAAVCAIRYIPKGISPVPRARCNTEKAMRHVVYENPRTRQLTLVEVPRQFVEGDALPIPSTARWFTTREELVASLTELFEIDEARNVTEAAIPDSETPVS